MLHLVLEKPMLSYSFPVFLFGVLQTRKVKKVKATRLEFLPLPFKAGIDFAFLKAFVPISIHHVFWGIIPMITAFKLWDSSTSLRLWANLIWHSQFWVIWPTYFSYSFLPFCPVLILSSFFFSFWWLLLVYELLGYNLLSNNHQ